MPAASNQSGEPFVIESAEQSNVLPPQWRRVACWVWKQEQPGMLALAEGLALLGLFCFSPWFSWYGVNVILGQITTPAATLALRTAFGPHSYSGLAMALGISIPYESSPFFGYLWLILLIALAFVFLAGLRLRRLITTRQTLAVLLALSGLALLTEAGLLLQTLLFQEPLDIYSTFSSPSNGSYIAASVLGGFWGTVGAQAAAIVAAVVLLKPPLPLRPARPASHMRGVPSS